MPRAAKLSGLEINTIRSYSHSTGRWFKYIEAWEGQPPIELKELLLHAERLAAMRMIEMLNDDTLEPEAKVKVAMDMLNRKGERGAAKLRAETKTVTHTVDANLAHQLATALRDPGVQERLKQHPEIIKALAPSPALPDEADYEVLDTGALPSAAREAAEAYTGTAVQTPPSTS